MSKFTTIKPDLKTAERTLPPPLLKAIHQIFNQNIKDVALVGGTALSGFYSGHRRSDDIDLFCKSSTSFEAAILAAESLQNLGAKLSIHSHSKQYFQSLCNFEKHAFTIDVVLDENLFNIGTFHQVGQINLVDLVTLFKMKAATLVSRCSEKDLYDLLWLFEHNDDESSNVEILIKSALEIDLGATAESILISLTGSTLSEKACDFSILEKPFSAYQKIIQFRKQLIISIREYEKGIKNSPLKEIVRNLMKVAE